MSKRKSPSPPQPPPEPRYEILAEGDPPRPVNHRFTGENDNDPITTPPRKSPPRRGPKTQAGKESSKQNATKTGLCQDIRHFRVLPGEDPAAFEDIVATLLRELQPWDTNTQQLADYIARAHWQLYRADFYFESDLERANGSFIDTATKFERYRASNQRRLIQLQEQFSDLRAARQKDQQTASTEAAKLPTLGPDGKIYEVDRQYQICKFSNNASPRHYIHNFATEKIIMSDGSYWFARTIPLAELMGGEFLEPQYGLGKHFTEVFREWRKTHKLYHPGVPYATKKWPPPIPKDCPPDDWFLDRELTLAEDPVAILKQRARKMDEDERRQREEEAAEWRRKIEEARQQEAEDQRLELEKELKPKQDEEKEEDEEEPQQERNPEDSDRSGEDK